MNSDVRPSPLLAAGQIRYQILLLVRTPLGLFLSLIVPLLLLVCLNLLTPGEVATGPHYAQFLTPAIGTFCLLNACYVNTLTGLAAAREQGVLKRLRGTPIPAWTYLAGRLGGALATATLALTVLIGTGTAFFHVTMQWRAFGYLLGAACLGVVVFFLLGMAVSTLLPTADSALPVAYGTILPLGFISDVFFSSIHAPHWLHHLASFFPIAPIARAMEADFRPDPAGWPIPGTGLLSLGCWALGAVLVTAVMFSWEPGPVRPPIPPLGRRRSRPARASDPALPSGTSREATGSGPSGPP